MRELTIPWLKKQEGHVSVSVEKIDGIFATVRTDGTPDYVRRVSAQFMAGEVPANFDGAEVRLQGTAMTNGFPDEWATFECRIVPISG